MKRAATDKPGPGSPGPRLDRRLLGVIGRFALYFVLADAVIFWLLAHTSAIDWLQDATASAAARLTLWSGVVAYAAGASVRLPSRVLYIGSDCTGIFLAAMLGSLMLAYPVKWWVRIVGVLGGVIVLIVANFGRLVAMAHLSVAAPAIFPVAHDFFFQVGMVLVVVGVWAAWLAAAKRHAG